MNQRFSEKLVLVAGGTGGLGRAVSLAFLGEGAKVVVTYRNEKEMDDLKQLGDSNSKSLAGHRVDVTDEAAVGQLVQNIAGEYGNSGRACKHDWSICRRREIVGSGPEGIRQDADF